MAKHRAVCSPVVLFLQCYNKDKKTLINGNVFSRPTQGVKNMIGSASDNLSNQFHANDLSADLHR